MSSDPLGLTAMLSDGPDTYGYAKQRPNVFVDPTGEAAFLLPAVPWAASTAGAALAAAGKFAFGASAGAIGYLGGSALNDWWHGSAGINCGPIAYESCAHGKGERGKTGSGHHNNDPYKHCREHPTDPNSILCKDPHTGKPIKRLKPSDWDFYKGKKRK